MANKVYVENYLPVVRLARGFYSKLPWVLSGSNATISGAASISSTGSITAGSGTATTAGGSTSGLVVGTSAIGVFVGSGAPTISAAQGSLYLRSDGSSTSTRAYINSDGGTTWVAVTTAS